MEGKKIMDQAEGHILHTYNRYPAVLDHGEGVYLYDTEGKKYLDFAAGIAVQALGYGDEEYNQALKSQVDKLIHTSNLYYNQPVSEAAEKLCTVSGLDRVFFTNSGTEAIEGALKTAKKYEPLPGIVRFADFNNLESVKALVNDKTCAVIMETIQGEGGIYPAEEGFLKGVKEICRERDILLILDEIQCGMGRSGQMFAWQGYGVKPDIMTCAKALGCGFPVGAFLMTEKVAEASLKPGDHGTTYGGNPFAGAVISKVLDIFAERGITEHVREIGEYLQEQLCRLKSEYSCIAAHRGRGLMQGLELTVPVGEVSSKALEQGLILITAGNNVLRFVPPLVIEKEHVDEMIGILKKIL